MWKFAIGNLLSRPARSALSLLGLTVAIAGMVGLFSVARGLEQTFDRSFKSIPGLIVMQAGAPIPLFSRLPSSWKADLEQVPGVHVVAPEVWMRANVIEAKPVMAPPRFLFGVDIASRRKLRKGVYTESMIEGRFLSAEDAGKRIVVISRQIAEEHHKRIGDTISVNGVEFEIVGLYHVGSLLLDVAILVDGDTLRQLGWFDPQAVSGFYIEAELGASNEDVGRRVKELLQDRPLTTASPMSLLALAGLGQSGSAGPSESGGGMGWLLKAFSGANSGAATSESNGESSSTTTGEPPPSELPKQDRPSPVEVRNASDFSERFKELSEDLNLILAVLTGIGMTIAVLSIVNTMLMSVTERVIEFGILKANGWTPWDVLKLITVESATLGLGGGVFGGLIGWIATRVINAQWPDRVNLFASPGLLVFSVVFSTVVGLLGGLYPAVWAMRLSPMEAIRRG
jgi:putative ABC transport system permease protein